MTDWKTPIWLETKSYTFRVLRPQEARELISAVDVNDEGAWKYLRSRGIGNKTLRKWLQALLFTGMRSSELYKLQRNPQFIQRDGNIYLPQSVVDAIDPYTGKTGKRKITIPRREVYLSDIGRKIIDEFMKSTTMPEDLDTMDVQLTRILHRAGTRIGLPEGVFTKTKRVYIKDDAGNYVTEQVQKLGQLVSVKKYNRVQYQQVTNGCTIRSMRKTWESWLTNTYGADQRTLLIIMRSQGHQTETAIKHYLTFQFDADDLADIRTLVKGYVPADRVIV